MSEQPTPRCGLCDGLTTVDEWVICLDSSCPMSCEFDGDAHAAIRARRIEDARAAYKAGRFDGYKQGVGDECGPFADRTEDDYIAERFAEPKEDDK